MTYHNTEQVYEPRLEPVANGQAKKKKRLIVYRWDFIRCVGRSDFFFFFFVQICFIDMYNLYIHRMLIYLIKYGLKLYNCTVQNSLI